eukprot:COSAG06_NODE_416_length_15996_cov_260.778637_10_plen_169_part_00
MAHTRRWGLPCSVRGRDRALSRAGPTAVLHQERQRRRLCPSERLLSPRLPLATTFCPKFAPRSLGSRRDSTSPPAEERLAHRMPAAAPAPTMLGASAMLHRAAAATEITSAAAAQPPPRSSLTAGPAALLHRRAPPHRHHAASTTTRRSRRRGEAAVAAASTAVAAAA